MIQEGISGDVLLGFSNFFKVIGIIPGHANKIIKFLDANKEKFQPKPIDENISIKNEEDIKSFFEKYIGFKGNLDNIKGENELKNLNEEDMKKLGLNYGQRLRLERYIKHFNSQKDKDIVITITKESSEEETNNYIKDVLKIKQDTIDNIGLDAEYLFDLTEDNLNEFLKDNLIQQNEFEILQKFIKKRDEKLKYETININKDSNKEDILKFIKEKMNFDIDKQDINELNFDKYEGITNEQKDIIQKFIIKSTSKYCTTRSNY